MEVRGKVFGRRTDLEDDAAVAVSDVELEHQPRASQKRSQRLSRQVYYL